MDKRKRRVVLVLVLVLFALLGGACSHKLEIVPSAPALLAPVATVMPQQHDLTIIAVDFDPALDPAQIRDRGGITLLVALENRGMYRESDIRLTAQLLDPGDHMRELSRESVWLSHLDADTLHMVRFGQVSEVPLRNRYRLVVSVAPVTGESMTADNARSYDIAARSEN